MRPSEEIGTDVLAVGRGPLRNRGHATLPETERAQVVPPAGPGLLDVRVRKVAVSGAKQANPSLKLLLS